MRSYRYRGATIVRRSSPLLGLCTAAVAGVMLLAPGPARADSVSPLYRSVRIVSSWNCATAGFNSPIGESK